MSRCFSKALGVLILLGVLVPSPVVAQVTITPYLWDVDYVNPATVNAPDLVARLQTEVQKILDTGRPGGTYGGLSVLQYNHHDQGSTSGGEQYWTLVKPGRIIETLALAYPYLTAGQKTSARAYVQAELASSTFQPWASSQLSPTSGNKREFFPITTRTYISYASFPTYTPTCEQMYGLWRWGWAIGGDWSDLTSYQTAIRSWYTSISGTCGFYGGMGAHIAKARLESSTIWNNSTNQTTATSSLQTAMNNGTTFSTVETIVSNGSTGLWRFQYLDSRKQNGQYLGWVFLGLSPEVGRYIASTGENITAALTRHADGKTKYPLWWVRQAGYDNGMSGVGANIEASGLSHETIGMIAPLERYAIGASAATLRAYTRSGPVCIGDPYWIELLVYAIEATGTLTWVDTRSGHP